MPDNFFSFLNHGCVIFLASYVAIHEYLYNQEYVLCIYIYKRNGY